MTGSRRERSPAGNKDFETNRCQRDAVHTSVVGRKGCSKCVVQKRRGRTLTIALLGGQDLAELNIRCRGAEGGRQAYHHPHTLLDVQVGEPFQDILVGPWMVEGEDGASIPSLPGGPGWQALPGGPGWVETIARGGHNDRSTDRRTRCLPVFVHVCTHIQPVELGICNLSSYCPEYGYRT